MPTLSGIYTSLDGLCYLAASTTAEGLRVEHVDKNTDGDCKVAQPCRLRANADFWLCLDDGEIGKYGNPERVVLVENDRRYHIWVEPRGFSSGQPEYGLVPISVSEDGYSNRFLAIEKDTLRLSSQDNWGETAKFRCHELAPNSKATKDWVSNQCPDAKARKSSAV